MVVADLLHSLGVSGSVVTVVAGLIALKHGRELFGVAATLGVWTKAFGVLMFLFLVSTSGLIPGLEVSVNVSIGTLARLAASAFDVAAGLIRALL